MSYGNSNYGQGGDQSGQGGDYGQQGGSGQPYSQPSPYNQPAPYSQPSGQEPYTQGSAPDAYGQQGSNYVQPGYNQGYAPPGGGYGGVQAYGYGGGYDAAHPPRPSVGFVEAAKLFFKNYANFYGRASRSEYWWMALWGAILGVVFWILTVLALLPAMNNGELGLGFAIVMILMVIVILGILIPSVALQVRRLHDAGFSGFFVLLRLAGLEIVPLIMCILPSKPEGVRYDNPDGSQPATA